MRSLWARPIWSQNKTNSLLHWLSQSSSLRSTNYTLLSINQNSLQIIIANLRNWRFFKNNFLFGISNIIFFDHLHSWGCGNDLAFLSLLLSFSPSLLLSFSPPLLLSFSSSLLFSFSFFLSFFIHSLTRSIKWIVDQILLDPFNYTVVLFNRSGYHRFYGCGVNQNIHKNVSD